MTWAMTPAQMRMRGRPQRGRLQKRGRLVEQRPHKHLTRLEQVWISQPIWFITRCTNERQAVLGRDEVEQILVQERKGAKDRHGWCVGSYVIMPDHVHFFCAPQTASKNLEGIDWQEDGLRTGVQKSCLAAGVF